MRHLDLFSGIGGFSLAAQWVWGNVHEIIAFCEIDPFCQKVLRKHWPDVSIISDIHDMKGTDYANVTLLTGGFPCQSFSCAGKRRGREDERYLWPQMLRVISEAKPKWIIAENVRGLLSIEKSLVFENVFSDLEAEGYETQAFIIPACAVGAPHRRDRVWIVGNSKCRRLQGSNEMQTRKKTGDRIFKKTSCNVAYPNSERRNGQPICLQPGESRQEGFEIAGGGQDASNSNILRMEGQRSEQQATGIDEQDWMHWWSVEPSVGRVVTRLSTFMDSNRGDRMDKYLVIKKASEQGRIECNPNTGI